MHGWVILAVACDVSKPSDILETENQVQAANERMISNDELAFQLMQFLVYAKRIILRVL